MAWHPQPLFWNVEVSMIRIPLVFSERKGVVPLCSKRRCPKPCLDIFSFCCLMVNAAMATGHLLRVMSLVKDGPKVLPSTQLTIAPHGKDRQQGMRRHEGLPQLANFSV